MKKSVHSVFIYLLITFLMVIVSSCVEELEIPNGQEYKTSLAISAKLTCNDCGYAIVTVSAVKGSGQFRIFKDAYNFKKVEITNSLNQSWEIPRTGNGKYKALATVDDINFEITDRHSYQLVLTTENDEIIVSNSEKIMDLDTIENLQESPEKESIADWGYRTYNGRNDLDCLQDSMTIIENNYFNPSEIGLDYIAIGPYNEPLPYPKESYFPTPTYLYSESLSPGAYEYWSQIKNNIERTGEMFDYPPGTISSNLTNTSNADNIVLGYFYATVQHRK